MAVVTGGGSGIGAALATRLAADGARVAVVDLDGDRAQAVAAGLPGAVAFGADVSERMAVEAMVGRVVAEMGPVEVYCSNAGVGSGEALGEDGDWALAWGVHAMAHVHAARLVLPPMVERRRGAFVITASAAGLLAMMQSAPYTVTKHASVALAEWLAITYGGDGVGVHCLAPQGVRTPMVTDNPRGEAEVAASGRILEPAEVAEAVMVAVAGGTFLILPHPEVHAYEAGKVADRDRWLTVMRSLRGRLAHS